MRHKRTHMYNYIVKILKQSNYLAVIIVANFGEEEEGKLREGLWGTFNGLFLDLGHSLVGMFIL